MPRNLPVTPGEGGCAFVVPMALAVVFVVLSWIPAFGDVLSITFASIAFSLGLIAVFGEYAALRKRNK